ncbi:MAG: division/cell wall cluster transcriptional repressor MraZ [Armatimonadota bacterium]|nr:division/cell wall cluster transcriptional repressor MraZ [Armatimonadota bacterium]MDR5702829.1 division/cell wall cluster transcriptional repressor MraZ [Armatimonadota bacterium]
MLLGEFHYTLDEKWRIVIPQKFRRALGDVVTVTRNPLDPCLFVFSQEEWSHVVQKLAALPLVERHFVRFLTSGVVECELDRQGRIVLPAHLREYAQIDRGAVVIGVINRVEIWSEENWKMEKEKTQAEGPQTLTRLQELIL